MTDEGEKFRFRRDMKIGTRAAENDNLLHDAFHDTGALTLLTDTEEPESLIVGRTGSGKSALLLHLERERPKNVIRINPKATSLQYLSNATALPELEEIGVNLSLFYHKLWQHVIIVELLREHFDIKNAEKQKNWLASFIPQLTGRDQAKADALEYIGEWDDSFFAKPEERVKQVTRTLEERIETSLGVEISSLVNGTVSGEASDRTVVEELREESQDIVQDIQIKRLEDMKRLAQEEILDDRQKPYYILIDDLDKKWVERPFAYDLINTLLDVASDFAKMRNIKLLIALRQNIIRRIHEEHRDPGRQRIKDNDLFLQVEWNEKDLEEMMDKRVRALVKGFYGGELGLDQIMPDRRMGGKRPVDYILERTLMRPRDFITYLNLCIREGVNRNSINWSIIQSVEGEYSRTKVKALEDEWEVNYPGLHELIEAFKGMKDGFRPEAEYVNQARLGTAAERWKEMDRDTYLGRLGHLIGSSQVSWREALERAVEVLYRVGVVGVKITSGHEVSYVHDEPTLLEFGLQDDSIVHFHPATYEALGVRNGKEAV